MHAHAPQPQVNAGNSIVFSLMGLGASLCPLSPCWTALTYSLTGCILAPVLVNKLGVKGTLILGSLGWSVYTASLCLFSRSLLSLLSF